MGYHNLTSDVEGEDEVLTCKKDQAVKLYDIADRAYAVSGDKWYQGYMKAMTDLFGSKCLPDEACNIASNVASSKPYVDSSEPKPAEPKHCFKVGDKVRIHGVNNYILCGKVGVIKKLPDEIEPFNYKIGFEDDKYAYLSEEYLEPYAEPTENMVESRKLSQETANCDKYHIVDANDMIDNIVKDGFREHNRLYIAAMAMQGILSNHQLLKITIEAYQEETGSPDMYIAVAKAAKAQADALIAESENGGHDGED